MQVDNLVFSPRNEIDFPKWFGKLHWGERVNKSLWYKCCLLWRKIPPNIPNQNRSYDKPQSNHFSFLHQLVQSRTNYQSDRLHLLFAVTVLYRQSFGTIIFLLHTSNKFRINLLIHFILLQVLFLEEGRAEKKIIHNMKDTRKDAESSYGQREWTYLYRSRNDKF